MAQLTETVGVFMTTLADEGALYGSALGYVILKMHHTPPAIIYAGAVIIDIVLFVVILVLTWVAGMIFKNVAKFKESRSSYNSKYGRRLVRPFRQLVLPLAHTATIRHRQH